MPSFFSSTQHRSSMLTNDEYEQDDFGLQERLNTETTEQTSKKGQLGSKVLSLFKKISRDAGVPLRLNICSRLFSVLETLVTELDDFSETIYRLLVFFLVEWHENKVLRNHLMSNFVEVFNNEKTLPIPLLI